jgi:hypothetical protein
MGPYSYGRYLILATAAILGIMATKGPDKADTTN